MVKQDRKPVGWLSASVLLVLIIVSGVIFIITRVSRSPGLEVITVPARQIEGKIYINGQVNSPGLYPVFAGDTMEDVIRSAGGLKSGADAGMIELSVASSEGQNSPQKIDINRAEAWLLEALPEVGETRALAIIQYRETHGFFHDVNELLNVPGFSEGVVAKIKDLVAVYD